MILFVYLLIMNAASFVLMHLDKRKAQKKKWRIPEAQLMWMAILGGSLGILLGMHLFRHKTLHRKFSVGIPLILLIQCVVLITMIK